MAKTYNQYCPIAVALDLVGERWSLLIVRELLRHDQLRYSDLHNALEGCGTNILASRLKELEAGGVVQKRRLPPPAACMVYELTDYGRGLQRTLHELAHWGARRMGAPTEHVQLGDDWLPGALQLAFPSDGTARVEFRIGGQVASLVEGSVVSGAVDAPDLVVHGDTVGFYRQVVDRQLDAVEVEGDAEVLARLIESLPPKVGLPELPAAV